MNNPNEFSVAGQVLQVITEQKGQYLIQTVIVETNKDYNRKVAVEVFGEERIKQLGIQEGETITIDINLESREWNGKWFTSVRAWRVNRASAADDTPVPQPTAQAPQGIPQAGATLPGMPTLSPASNRPNAKNGGNTSLPF